jgi:excisionase family DNA binding protein
MEGYVTLKDAAARLGYRDASALRQAIRREQLNAEKIGTTYLVKEEELQRYISASPKTGHPRGKPNSRPRGQSRPPKETAPEEEP